MLNQEQQEHIHKFYNAFAIQNKEAKNENVPPHSEYWPCAVFLFGRC